MNLCQPRSVVVGHILIMTSVAWRLSLVEAAQVSADPGENVDIEVAQTMSMKAGRIIAQ